MSFGTCPVIDYSMLLVADHMSISQTTNLVASILSRLNLAFSK